PVELLAERRRDRDRANSGLRLGVNDAEHLLDERHVPPAEPSKLACAQAGQDERQEHAARLVVLERLGDTPDLFRLQDPPVPLRERVPEEAVEGAEKAIQTLSGLLYGDVTDAVRLRGSTDMLQLWLELCEWSDIDERIA